MQPYYSEGGITIWNADCRSLPLPDQGVNCCVTSPPYWGLRDYGTARWEGGESSCDHVNKHGLQGASGERSDQTFTGAQNFYWDTCRKCGAVRIDSQIGLEATPEEYVARMVEVFREVRRVLRRDGTLWLNLGDSYAGSWGARGRGPDTNAARPDLELKHGTECPARKVDGLKPKDLVGIPWRVAFALQADGWYLRSDIIWSKPNPMPESVTDRPTKAHEYLFLLAKSARYYYDAEAIKEPGTEPDRQRADRIGGANGHSVRHSPGAIIGATATRNKRSVWTIPTQPYPEAHFATFPEELIKPCILAGCPVGGTVLDPFGGSGTTMQVARFLGRQGVMMELNEEYCDLAAKRLCQGVLDLA